MADSREHTLDHRDYTLAEAAALLGVSARTMRRWIRAGTLKADLIPGRNGPEYRVGHDQLSAVLARQEQQARPMSPRRFTQRLEQVVEQLEALDEQVRLLQEAVSELRDRAGPAQVRENDRARFREATVRAEVERGHPPQQGSRPEQAEDGAGSESGEPSL